MLFEDNPNGGIFLNVLSRKPTMNAFKIRGYIGKRAIIVLLDSGSTKSFIDSTLREELGIPIKDT